MSLIFAHRGASGHYPENTMIAFQKAIDLKSDGIELDIHITSDNIPIVCHDFTLDRTTNGTGLIKEKTFKEIRSLDAGSWFYDKYLNEKIPSLEEVFDLILPTNILINIEIKAGNRFYKGIEQSLIKLIKQYKLDDRCIISSFDHYSIHKVKQIAKHLYAAPLFECSLYEPWNYCKTLDANAIHPNYITVDQDLVINCNNNGIDINTYTVNDFDTLKALSQLGVNSIITNFPELKHKLKEE